MGKFSRDKGARELAIEIPHLPASELNPNNLRRQHWSVRHRATKEAIDEIGWLAKVQWH